MAGGQQSLPETLETPPGRRAPRRHDCGAVAVLRRGRAPNGRHASRLGRQRPRAPNGRRGRAPPGGLVTSAASARRRCHGEGRPGPAPLPAALGSAGRSRRLCPRHGAPACWGARRRPDRAAPAVPGSWIAPQGRPRPRQSAGKMAAWSRNWAVNCSTSKPKFDILLQTVTSGVGTRRRGRRSPAPASG